MRSKLKQSDDNSQVEGRGQLDARRRRQQAVLHGRHVYEEGLRLLIESQQESDEPKRAVILKTVEEHGARRRCAGFKRQAPDYSIMVRAPAAECLHT